MRFQLKSKRLYSNCWILLYNNRKWPNYWTEQDTGYLIGIDIWHCSSSPPPWGRLRSAPSYRAWFVILWNIWLIKRCIWCGATTGTRSSWTESFPSLLLSTSTAGFHFLLNLKILETLFTYDWGVFISTFPNIDAEWIPKVRVSTIVRSDAATWYETDWIQDRDLYF